MTDPVKRRYRSALRTSQAQETRRTIISAAGRLYVRDGYGATTIDAVATLAGVSRQTVLASVGGKLDLLRLAIEWAIAGDGVPVALADRPELTQLLGQPDPIALIRGWAGMLVEIDARVAALSGALEVAADADQDARALADLF